MKWLENIVEKILSNSPDGEIVVSSGVSPSGAYHVGTLREIMTAEFVAREIRMRGRTVRHLHISDDIDVFRKVPVDVPAEYEQYLGMPLCDIPSLDGVEGRSYADYFVADLDPVAKELNIDMEIVRAHEKYRSGFFSDAIEKTAARIPDIKTILEEVSGRKLDPRWTPIQVIENGRIKNRGFESIDTENKTIKYTDKDGQSAVARYDNGEVTLSWRIDWPARWWKLGVDYEPFGRDHATKGGSYDTGVAISKDIFGYEPPVPTGYEFINRTGHTKKMSKSAGDAVLAADLIKVMPPEVVWYFMFRSAPEKMLFFDTSDMLIKLFDEFSELLAKEDKTEDEEHLLKLCLHGVDTQTVSRVPFTHLYASYQSSLRDVEQTLAVIGRTEYAVIAKEDEAIIRRELKFIQNWLDNWAPEDVKFELRTSAAVEGEFTDVQTQFMSQLAQQIAAAPEGADGEWFHKAIYAFKESHNLQPKELFVTLYKILISKESGPRAGWFLSTLPRDWLIKQLSGK